jgi:hypothetical protein
VIPATAITNWAGRVPWPERDQIEQDLLLSRLIVEIASDPLLGEELVFRGGTAFHKVHLATPRRYSEDLDYVRTTHGPIGPVLDALRSLGEHLDLKVSMKVGEHPKVFLKGEFTSGAPLKVKIEMNTYETSPAQDLIRLGHQVDSPWWTGQAEVLTFTAPEMVATKLRALHQRRKGRDLFDLWLALTELDLDPADIHAAFGPYRPDSYTTATATATLNQHLGHPQFRNDLNALVATWPAGYDIDAAGALVLARVIETLPAPS